MAYDVKRNSGIYHKRLGITFSEMMRGYVRMRRNSIFMSSVLPDHSHKRILAGKLD